LKTRPTICPETSVTNSQSTLYNIPEEADIITTWRMTEIAHRTWSFPFRFSRYICVEISHKQISHLNLCSPTPAALFTLTL